MEPAHIRAAAREYGHRPETCQEKNIYILAHLNSILE